MRKTLTLVISLLLCLPVWAKGGHQSHHSSSTHTRSASTSHSHSKSNYYTNVDGKKVHPPVPRHTRQHRPLPNAVTEHTVSASTRGAPVHIMAG